MKDKISIRSLDNYQRLFQNSGMPYLISDIVSGHYRTLKCFLTFKDNIWTSYLPKEVTEYTLEEGLELYGDDARFAAYHDEFAAYQSSSAEFFEILLQKEEVSREQVTQFLEFAAGLFVYYSKTEFFYTDRAFLHSEHNPVLKANLAKLEHVKNSGREYLNKIFFGAEGYLNLLIDILSKQFGIEQKSLIQYNRMELLALFDDEKGDADILSQRTQSYVMLSDGESFYEYCGKDAEKLVSEFMTVPDEILPEIKGTPAHKGKVTGRVKVIFAGYDNFDQLKHTIEAMEKGDILVAESTSPELILACRKAGAIITNQGGLMSHAAIISRELNIPCIVGTGNATRVLKDGDMVEVDAEWGTVKILK